MVRFIVKMAYQIMFSFNQLMGSGLVLFQVVMMTQLQLSHQPLGDLEDWCDWIDRESMTSSGLQCEVCVVHIKWIKDESGLIKDIVC